MAIIPEPHMPWVRGHEFLPGLSVYGASQIGNSAPISFPSKPAESIDKNPRKSLREPSFLALGIEEILNVKDGRGWTPPSRNQKGDYGL